MTTKAKHPNIPLTAVKSSQIHSIGHHGDTLAVRFNHGGTLYHYHGVSADDYQKMMAADSLGSHLGKHIKPNFKFTKIDESK